MEVAYLPKYDLTTMYSVGALEGEDDDDTLLYGSSQRLILAFIERVG